MMKALLKHVEIELTAVVGEPVVIQDFKTLGGGCINHASRMLTNVGDFFIKWTTGGVSDIFVREAESLQELAKADTELIIPQVYLSAPASDKLPAYLVTEFLYTPEQSRSEMDAQLGRGIAQLHRFHQKKFGFHHDNYCGSTIQENQWQENWISFFSEQRIAALLSMIRKRRGLDVGEEKVYDKLIDRLPHIINHQPAPSLNHGDLWSGNYMYASGGPALIDPASYYADREFDLGMMGMFGGFSQRVWDAYQEEYPLPAEWRQRHDLYKLYHYLNHYFIFGGGYGQQALSIARGYS